MMPTAIFVPFNEMFKSKETFQLATKEIFAPFYVVTEYNDGDMDKVLYTLGTVSASKSLHFPRAFPLRMASALPLGRAFGLAVVSSLPPGWLLPADTAVEASVGEDILDEGIFECACA